MHATQAGGSSTTSSFCSIRLKEAGSPSENSTHTKTNFNPYFDSPYMTGSLSVAKYQGISDHAVTDGGARPSQSTSSWLLQFCFSRTALLTRQPLLWSETVSLRHRRCGLSGCSQDRCICECLATWLPSRKRLLVLIDVHVHSRDGLAFPTLSGQLTDPTFESRPPRKPNTATITESNFRVSYFQLLSTPVANSSLPMLDFRVE